MRDVINQPTGIITYPVPNKNQLEDTYSIDILSFLHPRLMRIIIEHAFSHPDK